MLTSPNADDLLASRQCASTAGLRERGIALTTPITDDLDASNAHSSTTLGNHRAASAAPLGGADHNHRATRAPLVVPNTPSRRGRGLNTAEAAEMDSGQA